MVIKLIESSFGLYNLSLRLHSLPFCRIIFRVVCEKGGIHQTIIPDSKVHHIGFWCGFYPRCVVPLHPPCSFLVLRLETKAFIGVINTEGPAGAKVSDTVRPPWNTVLIGCDSCKPAFNFLYWKRHQRTLSCKAKIIIQNVISIPSGIVSNGGSSGVVLFLTEIFKVIVMLRVTSLWQKQRKILISTFVLLVITSIFTFILICGPHLAIILSKCYSPIMIRRSTWSR
jgi:hypothetical protein